MNEDNSKSIRKPTHSRKVSQVQEPERVVEDRNLNRERSMSFKKGLFQLEIEKYRKDKENVPYNGQQMWYGGVVQREGNERTKVQLKEQREQKKVRQQVKESIEESLLLSVDTPMGLNSLLDISSSL